MLLQRGPVSKDARGFDDDVNGEIAPRKGGRVFLAQHPDVVSAHGQRAIAQGHLLVEGAHHGVVAQKVGEHVVIGQVVDGRDLDVRVGPLEDDAKNRPSDAPESVDGHPGAHEGTFIFWRVRNASTTRTE